MSQSTEMVEIVAFPKIELASDLGALLPEAVDQLLNAPKFGYSGLLDVCSAIYNAAYTSASNNSGELPLTSLVMIKDGTDFSLNGQPDGRGFIVDYQTPAGRPHSITFSRESVPGGWDTTKRSGSRPSLRFIAKSLVAVAKDPTFRKELL